MKCTSSESTDHENLNTLTVQVRSVVEEAMGSNSERPSRRHIIMTVHTTTNTIQQISKSPLTPIS